MEEEGKEEAVDEVAEQQSSTVGGGVVEVSVEQWEQAQREVKEWKEKYLHALAEGENSRKRLQKESQERLQHAVQKVIIEFLNPIDQFEGALKYAGAASPEVKNWAIGFEMIASHFKEVLNGHGVNPFCSEGELFDPHFHEAVEIIESEGHPPGTIVKEHLRGYKIGDKKLLRPARVTVSKKPIQEKDA